MKEVKFQFRLGPDERQALRRLAEAESRTMAGQLSHMIRMEAGKKGLWQPSRPSIVPNKSSNSDG